MRNFMTNNWFEICLECGGACCTQSCDLVPRDLAPLLSKYDMEFAEFFKGYLIVKPFINQAENKVMLRLFPSEVFNNMLIKEGLIDLEYEYKYPRDNRKCIFYDNGCSIHDIKPLGGRNFLCHKITGSDEQYPDEYYDEFWYNNQNIFYGLSEEIDILLERIAHTTLEDEGLEKLIYKDLKRAFDNFKK